MAWHVLAPGVECWATRAGLVVRAAQLRRVDLGSRAFEHALVRAIARGVEPPWQALTKESAARVRTTLIDEGVIELRHTEFVTPANTASQRAAKVGMVVVGHGADVRLDAMLDDAELLVYWLADRVVVAPHQVGRGACARCVLLLDAHRMDAAVPSALRSQLDAAERENGYAADGRSARVALREGDRLRNHRSAWPEPGRVRVMAVAGDGAIEIDVTPHPSCSCASWRGAAVRGHNFTWADAEARFTPVVAKRRDGIARVMFGRARHPWPLVTEAWGAATAVGDNACQRALGEAIERFCMHHAPPDVGPASAAELDGSTMAAALLEELTYRDEERARDGFRHARYSPSLRCSWSWAQQWPEGERHLVPTGLVGRAPDEDVTLVDATTNGYAAHTRRDKAVSSALLEVVERDAVLLAWTLGCAAPRIEADITVTGAKRVAAFLATQDIELPVIWMLAELEDGSVRSAAAAGVGFDDTWRRALAELHAGVARAPKATSSYDWSETQRRHGPLDHLCHYRDPRHAQPVLARMAAAPTIDMLCLRTRWPGAEDTPAVIAAALVDAGLSAWIVDRSVPSQFGRGWHVVRALVPGVMELSWGRAYRRLAGRRARDLLDAGKEAAPWPHPIA